MKNKITVYLADDDEDDRMLSREALESVLEGVYIKEFTNGRELLKTLHADEGDGEPSLIVLDINMPYINGLDVLSSIRSVSSLCHIPIVLLSTSSDGDTIKRAYQIGANAYFIKPVSPFEYKKIAYVAASCFLNTRRSLLIPKIPSNKKTTNILVIEDNADHWNLMELVLAKLGNVRLIHQLSADRTMSFLRSACAGGQRVDLIILDLYLPNREQGLDLIESIRGLFIQEKLAPAPILVFSASDHKDDIKASYQRQANAYITKSSDIARSAFYLNDICSLWATTIAMPRAVNKL